MAKFETFRSYAWHVEQGQRGASLKDCRLCYYWTDSWMNEIVIAWADDGEEERLGKNEFRRRVVPEGAARKFPAIARKFDAMPTVQDFLQEMGADANLWT